MSIPKMNAPTKTQWVLGSSPSRITRLQKSILKKRMLFCISIYLSTIYAPTKTQQVLGSSPSRITQTSIHKNIMEKPMKNIFSYFYPLIFYSKQTGNKICLEDNTERSESNPRRSLWTIY